MNTITRQIKRRSIGRLAIGAAVAWIGAGTGSVIADTQTSRTLQQRGPYDTGGYQMGSGIYNKWRAFGGRNGILGAPRSHEREASATRWGTTGRYVNFSGPAPFGQLIWHRNGRYAGSTFAVCGAIARAYNREGGTGSWLGFPISDEIDRKYDRVSRFERGYITWNKGTGRITIAGF